MRLKLNEAPMFKKMLAPKASSPRAPLGEAFGNWANGKIALGALLGATAGEAVVWYGGQFYALFFLTQTLKVPAISAWILIAVSLATRHAVLHPVRMAVGQDWPQADYAGGLCSWPWSPTSRSPRDHALSPIRSSEHALAAAP